jgi:glycine cleavage system H protein
MDIPEDLKFTGSDEWVRLEGNTATIGISDYAQDQLSDIVYLEIIVSEGDVVGKGDGIATVESVKAAADIYAPVGGTVTAINEILADTPELINTDPYGQAWMVKLDLADTGELEDMLDAAAYTANVQEREG